MSTLKLLCSAMLFAACGLLTSCSGDCTKAEDCAADEVCYQETCQKALSPFFDKTCQVDTDCDGDGNGQTQFYCELGRCRLRNTMPIVVPDTGVGEAGTGDTGVDTGVDTGITDTGTTAGGDN